MNQGTVPWFILINIVIKEVLSPTLIENLLFAKNKIFKNFQTIPDIQQSEKQRGQIFIIDNFIF